MKKKQDLTLEMQSRPGNYINPKPIRLSPGGYRVNGNTTGQEALAGKPASVLYTPKRMGWLPDIPDFRDYALDRDTLDNGDVRKGKKQSVKQMIAQTRMTKARSIPASVDLRKWFSPIKDQGDLGSCTAHAGISIYEYFERRAFGKYIEGSRLFLYKATRNLMHETGDTGAELRTTMGAMALFGVPPEEHWPYAIDNFDMEPTAFCYAFAQNYQAISYCRLDQTGKTQKEILGSIKECLAAGLPSMFGFTVYDSVYQAERGGKIPMPVHHDKMIGGHAVAAAGYDDNIVIENAKGKGSRSKGALIIRNSWGESFGDDGYCYLPYDYILKGIADDFWVMLKGEWINTGNFKI